MEATRREEKKSWVPVRSCFLASLPLCLLFYVLNSTSSLWKSFTATAIAAAA
jgi:hypothetical protein